MRRLAAAALLALPALLAFGRGGYFGVTRVRVALLACVLLAVAAFVAERPLPRSRHGRLALGGLAALTAWTGLSLLWAPVQGPAFADFERLILYTAAFGAGIALFRDSRWVEPALLGTIVATALYGLSERVLPSIFALDALPSADDRLAHPLTYWNGQGALAAMGLVLAAGLAARGQRLAVAAAPILGLDLYLTLSRGAIGAGLAGLAVLVALQPTRAGLRAALVVVAGAALASAAALALPGVQDVDGSTGQGIVMIAVIAALSAAAYFAMRADATPVPRLRPLATAALVALLAGTVIAVATSGSQGAAGSTEAGRLVSVQSNRYAYWEVAVDVFADHPLQGVGSGAFAVEWLQRRDIAEGVKDAHSLYLETAAELGIVGLLALAAFLVGIVGAARRRGAEPAIIAALVVFALHAGLDWDWELPALGLTAILLAAKLLAEAD
ncbi:O-antigen ligase family protein [Solirubrobacter phytolaccae]|uniref:O-antigen ligase family protein n=1 Tax=Solirubrobacter phytolaccae TaxID=1404360 RepID=A0A9X3SCK6_9ACTN|nr:O-antigen ligase family protein [Solirubrobacter phytolaccae]MDA0182645.1 O-antigen ligase family protein [Solirubrobacter phytolaccae]